MTGTHSEKKIVCLIFVVLLAFLLCGCAGKKTAKKDAFFEKWKVMAENSKGHSPAASPQTIEPTESIKKKAALEEESVRIEKSLPTKKTSLKMHKTDISVVLRALARAADQNILINSSVKGDITPSIVNIPWNQAFLGVLRTRGLVYTWEGEILRVMTLEDMEHDLKILEMEDKQKAQQLEPRIINIKYADAKKLCDNLKQFLTKDSSGKMLGSVMVDEHTNSLIIQAASDDIAGMIKLIRKIDKPSVQIRIEANIVETSKSTARNLGIQWGGMYRSKGFLATSGDSDGNKIVVGGNVKPGDSYESGYKSDEIEYGTHEGFGVKFPADIVAQGASLGLMFGKLGSNILDLQLSALQKKGELNILSRPSITALDNQQAVIESGTEVPIRKTVSTGATATEEVEYKKAVLRLEVTPGVIEGDILKLILKVKKDELDFTRQVQGYPVILTKSTENTLILKDGETAVIAGLSKETIRKSESGVPWLKDIPFFGWLFKGENKGDDFEDLLIFITPHILKEDVASQGISQ